MTGEKRNGHREKEEGGMRWRKIERDRLLQRRERARFRDGYGESRKGKRRERRREGLEEGGEGESRGEGNGRRDREKKGDQFTSTIGAVRVWQKQMCGKT